jgi:hypothetical protein
MNSDAYDGAAPAAALFAGSGFRFLRPALHTDRKHHLR